MTEPTTADLRAFDGPDRVTVEASSPERLGPGQTSIWPDGVEKHRVASTEEGGRPLEDAALIAAAVNALPAMLDQLDAQAARIGDEREFAARMSVACDRTRAVRGRDEVAVKTSDWHALMSLAENARRRQLLEQTHAE